MKKCKILLSAILGILLLGCNGIKQTPSENDILSDLSELYPSQAIECADRLEIIRSQLFEDEKKWTTDVAISASNEYAQMLSEITVVYDYYDNQGWILNTEETMYPSFTVEKTNSEMTDDDIQDLLYVWAGDQIEYVDNTFDSDSGVEYITYKMEQQESFYYNSVTYGTLTCCYYGPDSGWNVVNDIVDSKDFLPITENLVGNYDATCHAGGWNINPRCLGYYNFNITDISQDGKSLTISGYKKEFNLGNLKEAGDVTIKENGENRIIMYQNQDYHAELVEYKQDGSAIEAVYQITDLEAETESNKLTICTSSATSGEWEYMTDGGTVSEAYLHIQMFDGWFWKV